jgi:aminoglycoside 3-N-acetyltransferase
MPFQSPPTVGAAGITEGLAALGVRAGDVLLLHGALSSLGRVDGGAPAVVEAILSRLGPGGTLLAPTLPDIHQPFSPETSPSTVGRLSEVVRQWPGAVRSRHPTHAVSAIGAQARTLTAGHEETLPCGPDSPYGKLASVGGLVLLLGVDQDRNTTWHAAETIAGVPYLCTLRVRTLQADGTIKDQTLGRSPAGHRAFIELDRPLREAGLLRIGRVGQAVARLMRADEILEWGVKRLGHDPAAFLCGKPRCVFCQWARATIRGQAGQIDWAERTGRWGCADPRCEVCVV